jgi:hypothetical protein
MKTRGTHRPAASAPLKGLCVGISGAVPDREDWGTVKDLDQRILRFVSQFSALVMKYGGKVVHGSHPTFTPVLKAQAERLGSAEDEKPLTLLASELFGDPPAIVADAERVARVILTPRIGEGTADDPQTRNGSLTALRLMLAKEVDVVVAIGGKLHRSTGYNPGVLQELTVARWAQVPCFVVASYGGLAGAFEVDAVHAFSAENQMDPKMSAAMASWTDDVDEYAGRLLEHLIANRDRFVRNSLRTQTAGPALFIRGIEPLDRVARPAKQIDGEAVRAASERFAAVRRAFDAGDVDTLSQLLKPPPSRHSQQKKARVEVRTESESS